MISVVNLLCMQFFNLVFSNLNFPRVDVGSTLAPRVLSIQMEWEGRRGELCTIWDNISGWDFLIPHVEELPPVSSLFIRLFYRSEGGFSGKSRQGTINRIWPQRVFKPKLGRWLKVTNWAHTLKNRSLIANSHWNEQRNRQISCPSSYSCCWWWRSCLYYGSWLQKIPFDVLLARFIVHFFLAVFGMNWEASQFSFLYWRDSLFLWCIYSVCCMF